MALWRALKRQALTRQTKETLQRYAEGVSQTLWHFPFHMGKVWWGLSGRFGLADLKEKTIRDIGQRCQKRKDQKCSASHLGSSPTSPVTYATDFFRPKSPPPLSSDSKSRSFPYAEDEHTHRGSLSDYGFCFARDNLPQVRQSLGKCEEAAVHYPQKEVSGMLPSTKTTLDKVCSLRKGLLPNW